VSVAKQSIKPAVSSRDSHGGRPGAQPVLEGDGHHGQGEYSTGRSSGLASVHLGRQDGGREKQKSDIKSKRRRPGQWAGSAAVCDTKAEPSRPAGRASGDGRFQLN
jgi:hypothetical protein